MLYELRSVLSALKKLRFRLSTPGTGPYVGIWGLTIYVRDTDKILVSLCLTPDGWCVRPFRLGAGLYRKGTVGQSAYWEHVW